MQNSCETEITYQKKLNFSIVNFTAIFRNLTFPANDFDQFDALVSTLGQKREVTLLALKEVQGKVHTWMNGNFKLFQFSINCSPCQSQKAFHSFFYIRDLECRHRIVESSTKLLLAHYGSQIYWYLQKISSQKFSNLTPGLANVIYRKCIR